MSGVSPTRIIIQEHGRICQGQEIKSYMIPCDKMEQDHLNFFHAVFMAALHSTQLIHVPDTFNDRFLDLGCGMGIGAIELANAYPDTYIFGVDISAIQPLSIPLNSVFRAPSDYKVLG
ncbi:hypothetical protein BDV24DRAFT_15471 [Aspergillus arachidicola]|uniref:Uncharacterized protein n=1 Tax=Aspergillus arachidicola TaxID=656916 RepID=A0A5N6XP09_9EURO|nr:hypothetical protein BDV24DRAFT_15471 [Aspergillus arachidicola]